MRLYINLELRLDLIPYFCKMDEHFTGKFIGWYAKWLFFKVQYRNKVTY